MDNCEHLVQVCAELATTLLRSCPELHILATSREVLAVAGEITYQVPSLAVPDQDHLPPAEQLPRYEAIRLFVARAQARRPEFALTAANANAVAQVCARLDGMPLAIELAAARISVLSVEGIVARLDDRFRLLTGGLRTALPRQQTLRATLDWSYRLLAPDEQQLFARLSAFAGGCTFEAAAAVATPLLPEIAALDGISSLIDKCLLQRVAGVDDEPRFAMLETIRDYARLRLEESGEAEMTRRQHVAYYLALAEKAEAEHFGPQQPYWMQRLEDEIDNLRVALRWLLNRGEATPLLRFAAVLWRFWMLHSHLHEGGTWLDEILALPAEAQAALCPPALHGAGVLAYRRGAYAQARSLHEEALALYRDLGDQVGVARSLNLLGNLALDHDGDLEHAQQLYSESLRLARELDLPWLAMRARLRTRDRPCRETNMGIIAR
jgi:non-specific serine/threonine protein kinase